jgi:hypothetical protein
VDDGRDGDHLNCPACHRVFDSRSGGRPPSVRLYGHPALPRAGVYAALAAHGIHPDSPMDDVQDVFPETNAEEDAVEVLRRVSSRLLVDLFMAPLEDEENDDGP